jgi:hypothetical protein
MHTAIPSPVPCKRAPWNKGRLIGQKRPLKPKDVWAIRVRLRSLRFLFLFYFRNPHAVCALRVDRTIAGDPNNHLVQVPSIARAGTAPP